MLFRVSGRLVDGKSFALRSDAPNAIAATASAKARLNANKVDDDQIASITSAKMKESNEVHIGEPRVRKVKAAAAEPVPARAGSRR